MNVVVRQQALALGALGHDVEILTRRSSPSQPDAMAVGDGVTLRVLTAGPARELPKGEHEAWIDAFGDALRGEGPWDVIHSHHWFSGMAALPVARERGIPHLQSFHSIAAPDHSPLSDGERAESPGRLAGEAMLARASDGIVAVSTAEASTAVDRLGADPRTVAVVRPGVDSVLFHPEAAGAARPRAEFVVAARLHPLKGIALAVEALALLPRALGAHLVVAGSGSAEVPGYRTDLEADAARLGVADRVRFVGALSRPELAVLFRGASAVLVPSYSETFGLVATEASASGVPVIASAAGGLIEAVDDDATGRVIADRDPGHWADAMTTVLTDLPRAARWGEEGRRRALARGWDVSAAELAETYAAAVDGIPLPLALGRGLR
ncbi:glycosyltransferase [Mycetocola reblochoni]|uniref:D-inositol 3-phosphate glycosyltransferase n=3 Tax=Mycetocola reblochoni TaxID=331618 RepID=A0A1R4IIL2_9MICO|nr:glycosyltransferase [Mycetocola reblochoni]SJN19595.1 Glycosyltransferase MshA involved in mycothiol biosynthesis [Mycetocola reblochoni REB411]